MSENNRTMVQGVIWKQLLRFFFPIVLGTFFQQLYNTVDTIIVSNFSGTEAVAAVGGSSAQIIQLLVGFFVGMTSGASVVVSQCNGRGDREATSRAVHTAIAISLVAGIILTLIGIPLAQPLLLMMDTPVDTLDQSTTYLTIYFAGIIAQLLYNAGSGILRALGDSKRPLYYLIACCLLNTVLDLLFVAVFHMGAGGAAIATVLSQVVSAALVLGYMMRAKDDAHLSIRRVRLDATLTRSMLRIGLPEGSQAAMYSISNTLIQRSVNQFHTPTVAAWTMLGKVDGLHWMVMTAFGIAITTFSGQNFGARQFDRIKRGIRTCLVMAIAFSLLFSLTMYLWGDKVMGIFGETDEIAAMSLKYLYLLCPFYFLYAPIEILSGGMRGVGDVLPPTTMTLTGICLFRLAWIYIALPIHHAMETVALSYPISWGVTAIMFLVYYRWGNWMERARIRTTNGA